MSVQATLAMVLHGNAYGREISRENAAAAREDGLVVVFGRSDALIEFRGAIDAEEGCGKRSDFLVTSTGLFDLQACSERCVHFKVARTKALREGQVITAVWNADGYNWIYRTAIPHATFDILEDGRPYCRGLVFALADVGPVAEVSLACTMDEQATRGATRTPGLYRLYWRDGGSSLASVGMLHDGRRWFAPTNWTSRSAQNIACTDWQKILRVERIVTEDI